MSMVRSSIGKLVAGNMLLLASTIAMACSIESNGATPSPSGTAGAPPNAGGTGGPYASGAGGASGTSDGTAGSASGAGGTQAGTSGASGTSASDASTPMGGSGGDRPPPACTDFESFSPADCSTCVEQGSLQGLVAGPVCSFLGIPYAKPPVGPLRFAPPQPPERWSGVRGAIDFGAACVQVPDVSIASTLSEDCLFLNVFTPATAHATPLPVLVFIHGGGFYGGAANIYSGAGLAERGPAVVVTMNYRVGSLGFFAHPALDKERADAPAGSDGIRDQQHALRWVQQNIASFGGDASNVTLFGQSAGASSTCIHLVSPGSRELAQRFILQSGVCAGGGSNSIEPVARDTAYGISEEMVAELCPAAPDLLSCMRGLPAEDLQAWTRDSPPQTSDFLWRPVIEGEGGVLPEHPDALIASGRLNPGEIIAGTTENEWALFTLFDGPVTVPEVRTLVQAQYGDLTDALMAYYAPNDAVDASHAYVRLKSDAVFRCPTRAFVRAVSAQGAEVYLYSFEDGAAQHTDEIAYLFGPDHYAGGFLAALGPWPASLIEGVPGYWLNFARVGDPNGAPLLSWPQYEASSELHMVLADPPTTDTALARDACDFWESLK